MENIAENYINNLTNIYKEAKERYDKNKEIIIISDNETLDLLHEIELTTFNACRGWWLSLQLKNVRKARRKAKDENELLNEFICYCNNKAGENSKLDQLKDNSISIHKSLLNRVYQAKVRNDLLCTNNIRKEKYIASRMDSCKFKDGMIDLENSNEEKIPNINILIKNFKKEDRKRKNLKYR